MVNYWISIVIRFFEKFSNLVFPLGTCDVVINWFRFWFQSVPK